MRLCFVLAVVLVVGCGDDGGGGEVDAPGDPTMDGSNPMPDVPNTSDKQIGSLCTPDNANPQGDCPAGFLCLNLVGASHPWCSKPCNSTNDTCMEGYTGPGLASCYLTVNPAGGGQGMKVCGIVCDDLSQGNSICPDTQCNGMCPAQLMCTRELTDNSVVVAKACQ